MATGCAARQDHCSGGSASWQRRQRLRPAANKRSLPFPLLCTWSTAHVLRHPPGAVGHSEATPGALGHPGWVAGKHKSAAADKQKANGAWKNPFIEVGAAAFCMHTQSMRGCRNTIGCVQTRTVQLPCFIGEKPVKARACF